MSGHARMGGWQRMGLDDIPISVSYLNYLRSSTPWLYGWGVTHYLIVDKTYLIFFSSPGSRYGS